MKKLIQFLIENPTILPLLQENKLSLVGVSSFEQKAIIESVKEKPSFYSYGWR